MKKALTPSKIGFYILMLISCLLLGFFIAGFSGAGKNQGLAGGAIVLGYGVIAGAIGFIASFFIASIISKKALVLTNWVLLILILLMAGYTQYRFQERQKEKKEQQETPKRIPTKPAIQSSSILPFSFFSSANKVDTDLKTMGIGFFKPNFYEHKTLYLYSDINLEKGLMEHMPKDSVVFGTDQYGNPTATHKPEWLKPEYFKLDYGIITFKVLSMGFDFIEVVANNNTKKKIYLDKNKGTFLSWPQFLLSVSSVEFADETDRKVYEKPDISSENSNTDFEFMKPILVQDNWMYVKLMNHSMKEVGKGWVLWRNDSKLLIKYSVLS